MTLRVAVIGAGSMGKNHVRVLSNLEGVELIAICDKNTNNVLNPNNVPVFDNIQNIIDLKPDYCIIATPTEYHEDIAIELAKNKIHCLIEKPLSFDRKSCQRIIKAFKRNEVIGAVGHIERYNSALIKAKQMMDEGILGEIYQIATRRQSPFPARIADVGVVKDLLIHDIDIVRWLSGSEYANVSAYTTSKSNSNYEDLVSVSGKMENNIVISHIVNWLSPQKERKTIVTGEKGCLIIDTLNSKVTLLENGNFSLDWNDIAGFRGVTAGKIIQFPFDNIEPLLSEHKSFRDIINGCSSDIINLEQGLNNILVAEKILDQKDRK